jgi:hypothetical protein
MNDDDEFLRSIPDFLRRTQEPPPRKPPVRPRDLPAIRNEPRPESGTQSRPRPIPAPAAAPVAPASPLASPPASPPASPTASPKVVEMARPSAAAGRAATRPRIALAFENRDLAEAGSDRISLPREVARQICMLAVERDTTQRAVVLRALRLAGLSVAEGSDGDRPGRSATRHA